MTKEKIIMECENCGTKTQMNKPFGTNKYLIKFVFSKCPNCENEVEKK